MSPLEVLQIIGYSTGAWLHLWIGALLFKQRRSLGRIERVLFALTIAVGLWHASNFALTLRALLGLEPARWANLLRFFDSIAVISITLCYSLLLHVHLHLWADAKRRVLNFNEHARIYLSYIPALFLFIAVPQLWRAPYAPMLDKLAQLHFLFGLNFVQAFLLWGVYALGVVAVTDLLLAREASKSSGNRRFMGALAASFIFVGLLLFAVFAVGNTPRATLSLYLQTFANLGSLLPTALLAYHIYRHRFLQLIVKESLVIASFATVVLIIYLYGIRMIGDWLTTRYGLRADALEMLSILALALAAAPLRDWLDRYFQRLVRRETELYHDLVAHIGAHTGHYDRLPELFDFIEERTRQTLRLRRVRLIDTNAFNASDNATGGKHAISNEEAEGRFKRNSLDNRSEVESSVWLRPIIESAQRCGWRQLEGSSELRTRNYELAYALRREDKLVGLMLIDAAPEVLTRDVRTVLEVLAGQVAIAIEDCWLIEENNRLERRLAQDKRLAELGRVAATVAHEVKNPLSAIKSIAQVMREDEKLNGEYARDLDLIVGETNRLSSSVTQLLSFARTEPPTADASPCRVDDLLRSIIVLFRIEATERQVCIDYRSEAANIELDGRCAAALRDALSNLLLNAMHATVPHKRILIEAQMSVNEFCLSVTDGGAGVNAKLRERIWEPFFTTKQRGTGLGLAIVRQRIEEVGGTVQLANARVEGGGARFEIRLPVACEAQD